MTALGVFGGSFNPVHRGHLFVAQLARESAGLDGVIFVPARRPPHKTGEDLAGGDHRLAMLRLALAEEPDAAISEVELEPDGPRYTVDTLTRLRGRHPGVELHFIMGLDSLRDFPGWREPARILDEFAVIAVDRPGVDAGAVDPALAARCRVVTGNPFAISSTTVRARVRRGLPVRHLVPAPVELYISEHGLYGGPGNRT